jgi:hypothetical protein
MYIVFNVEKLYYAYCCVQRNCEYYMIDYVQKVGNVTEYRDSVRNQPPSKHFLRFMHHKLARIVVQQRQ